MADLKDVEMVSINDIKEDSMEQREGKSGSRVENKPILEVINHGFMTRQNKISIDPLQRYINPTAIVNFGFTLQAAWEASGVSFQFSLLNGGPASLVYGSLFAGIGSTLIALSLAEMASM
jgi:hypothetical protein